LNLKDENLYPAQYSQGDEIEEVSTAGKATTRKAFVEPEVSFPIDVLEATTFFQFTESGATN